VLLGTLWVHLLVVGGLDEQSSAGAVPATSHQVQTFLDIRYASTELGTLSYQLRV